MKKNYTSLMEVYEACKHIADGELRFVKATKKGHQDYIKWKINETVSAWIDEKHFEIQSGKKVIMKYNPNGDYDEICKLIIECNQDFKPARRTMLQKIKDLFHLS